MDTKYKKEQQQDNKAIIKILVKARNWTYDLWHLNSGRKIQT